MPAPPPSADRSNHLLGLDSLVSDTLSDNLRTKAIHDRVVTRYKSQVPSKSRLALGVNATFRSILEDLQQTLQDIRLRHSPLRAKIDLLLRRIDSFAGVIDPIAQYVPAHGGELVWGGFRLAVKLALDQTQILERRIENLTRFS